MMDDLQRRRYTASRLGKALVRMQSAKTKAEKEQASKWAAAWGTATGVAPRL